MARKRQKIVWSNPQTARTAGTKVPTHHLGRLPYPETTLVAPAVGSLWLTTGVCYIISDPWAGSELESEGIAYLSTRSYGPSPKSSNIRTVPGGTPAVYAGSQRFTEWDGRGTTRPERPTFIVDGVLVALVEPSLVRQA